MMIPLRRALIVQQHGVLKYPEGTACAEVLKAGASAESRAAASPAAKARTGAGSAARPRAPATIFTGFGIGLVYKALNVAFKGWKDVPEKVFGAPFAAGSISAEISPELLGVGYIIGPRIAVDHVRRRRARLSGAHPADQVLRLGRDRRRSRRARCPISRDVARTTSATPTCSTSAPARWRPAASSACCARCRRSGAACAKG